MIAYKLATLGVLACSIAALLGACSSDPESGTTSAGGSAATSTSTTTGAGGATSVTATATTTATTTSTGSGNGITCTDGAATNMGEGECDLLQQDCPPGETCRPNYVGDVFIPQCVGGAGLKGAAEQCSDDAECKAGLFCLGSANKQCLAICCPDNDEPCGGGQCSLKVDWNETEFFTFMCSYSQLCELFTPGSCPQGLECHIEDTSQGLTGCVGPSPTQVGEGEECTYLNDCGDSQFCFSQGNPGICRYNCDLAAPAGTAEGLGGCPVGQTCQANFDFGIPGISVCLP